jgi:hypothetical protein
VSDSAGFFKISSSATYYCFLPLHAVAWCGTDCCLNFYRLVLSLLFYVSGVVLVSRGQSWQALRALPGLYREKLDFLHLPKLQLHWRCPSKNRDGHTQATFFVINFFDIAVEVGKRAFFNTDHLAYFE